MKVSVFTPTHDPQYLRDAYESVKAQDVHEWVILYNNGAEPVRFQESWIKEYVSEDTSGCVGAYKAEACAKCEGDILLELDHDDLLLEGAVEAVKEAFTGNSELGMAYSNSVACSMEYEPREHFDPLFGWSYRPFNYKGYELEECVAFPPIPAAVSRIWYAPNHLRAFSSKFYKMVGGHNKEMRVLDDLDLMCRLYTVSKFYHIDRPLYLYRVHGDNSWIVHNSEIQNNVYRIYYQYIENLALKWAKDNNLLAVDLGGRFNKDPRYMSVDLKDADVIADLEKPWPFGDGTVGVVRARDVFEHLRDPLHTMKELYRVLCPAGYAFITVPSTDGRGAFQDPTHVSYWNENSFLYYTDHRWSTYIDTPVSFQAMQLGTSEKNEQGVCWVEAHLLKLYGNMSIPGLKFI